MHKKPPVPGLWRIALADFWVTASAGLAAVLLIALIAILIFTPAERRAQEQDAVAIFILTILALLAFIAVRLPLRAAVVRRRWQRGVPFNASVIEMRVFGVGPRRWRYITVRYTQNGQLYHDVKKMPGSWLPKDQAMPILIDPDRPEKPIYIDDYYY